MCIQSFGLGDPIVETSSELLGGKGAGLVWMTQNGVPVPPGFIIPTTVWAEYKNKPPTVMKQIDKELQPYLEALKVKFGYMPLLSVRSGARVSCPGMMDTILNVGLDESNEAFWRQKLGDDCYLNSLHRLVSMYGSVVEGLDRKAIESLSLDRALSLYSDSVGTPFPWAKAQLLGSIEAVFKSWYNDRAVFYRKMNNIPVEWGTACTVQAMVFGNLNNNSGTGVLFTRNPDTGLAKVTGEFLVNAQGEDVVAGVKTDIPVMPLTKMSDWNDSVYTELQQVVLGLEKAKKDVQDVEFTIQDGKLYILQTRTAKRSALAAIKIAMDMQEEGLIDVPTMVKRVSPREFDLSCQALIDPSFTKKPAFKGIPACSGVVSGYPVFTSKDAVLAKAQGQSVILVTEETTPDDIEGMHAAVGVLTMHGGATSHAAVVARSMNKPCVVGLGNHLHSFHQNSILTIDGKTGRVWHLKVPVVKGDPSVNHQYLEKIRLFEGVDPVVHSVPALTYSSAWLVLGDAVVDVESCVQLIGETASKITGTLLVDFGNLDLDQMSFLDQIGCKKDPLPILGKLHKSLREKIVLIDVKFPGFKTVAGLEDLESLVLAEGHVALMGAPSPAMEKVLEWRAKDGLQVVSVGARVLGCKAFLAPQQLL